jgi:peroxiredoxin
VAVSPQLQPFCKELVTERRLPFEVLSDRGLAVAGRYGVAFALPEKMRWVYRDIFQLDLPKFNGDDSWMLPMPARFIVDQKGLIQSAEVSLDHTVRPEPAATIEILEKIKN